MNNTGEQGALSVGNRLGPFEITVLLGRGGMGEVWRARDTRLGRHVAVKVLPKAFAADPDRLRRFEQEAKTLASLNHPNILMVFETGQHDGAAYLVSELLEGQTLRQELTHGGLSVRKTIGYALQVAQGLATAHANGVVHRDLKPENLFVTRDGRLKILDFGLAKFQDPSEPGQNPSSQGPSSSADASTALQSTAPGILLGTPGYMAPEQIRGQAADHRSDIFAFGGILYEMLSGRRPFKRDTGIETMNSILNEEPPELRELQPNIPPRLERLVRRCLEKQPDNRFQSAKDLAFALENLDILSTPAAPQPGAQSRADTADSESSAPPIEAARLAFRPNPDSDIRAPMTSPEPKAPTLQELPDLRRKTERVSKLLWEQLNGNLETLRPLFAPERLLGKHAGGRVEVTGAERALTELQQGYRAFTAKPYDLPATLDTTWLGLVGQVVALEPWEYEIALQGKSIAMSSPVKWVLVFRSNYTLGQVKRVLAGQEAVRLDHLRQFVVNALVLQLLLARNPKLVQLFGDLGWEVKQETTPELKDLPLMTATSILNSFRPPDDLIIAATAFSGVPAFIELIDLEAARHPKNPLQQKLEELLRD